MEEACRFISLQKAYCLHTTRLLRRVEEITENGTVCIIEDPNLTALMAIVEQLESILEDLDRKIA